MVSAPTRGERAPCHASHCSPQRLSPPLLSPVLSLSPNTDVPPQPAGSAPRPSGSRRRPPPPRHRSPRRSCPATREGTPQGSVRGEIWGAKIAQQRAGRRPPSGNPMFLPQLRSPAAHGAALHSSSRAAKRLLDRKIRIRATRLPAEGPSTRVGRRQRPSQRSNCNCLQRFGKRPFPRPVLHPPPPIAVHRIVTPC